MRGPFWLCGMMGAGKSAVGRALAGRLGLAFFDADHEVEVTAGRSVAEIFEAEGEAGFRKREAEAIDKLAGGSGVVALGGGALTQKAAQQQVGQVGVLIYLRAEAQTLAERIGGAGDRPLVAGLDLAARGERLAGLLRERASAYEKASIIVDTDGLGIDEVAESLVSELESIR